jgi:hypothetical protein
LAVKAKLVGRRVLNQIADLATPDTLLTGSVARIPVGKGCSCRVMKGIDRIAGG